MTAVDMPPVLLASGASARSAWPLDPGVAHLNHGSFGAAPTVAGHHQDALRVLADRNPVGWFPRVAEHVAAARELAAPFVGARADDTAFVPNASAAATVVCNSLRLDADDEILVTDHGYGAITMAAARLARRFGARVTTLHVPLDADEDGVLELFRREISNRTRLIVVDQITSPTARHLPSRRITELAHERGVRVLVDGAHAPGLVADAAAAGGGDWWFGNMHKWPCAPRGSALLVTRADDRDDLWPLIDSWGAHETYPRRFDSQGTIDATTYLATPTAIDFIEHEYGWARARTTLAEIADASAERLAEALQDLVADDALVTLVDPAPSMRLIRLPEGLAATREAADQLRTDLFDRAGIEVAFSAFDGRGYVRLSVHLYTESRDIDAFIERGVPEIRRQAATA